MSIDLAQLQQWVAMLLWPLARVTGLMLMAPVFGASTLPAQVKAGLMLILTLTLAPLAQVPQGVDPLSLHSLLVVTEQLLTGAAIGLVLRLAFEAISMAGQLIASTMGLGFSEVVDPVHGGQTSSTGQFYLILATLLFLTMNGHLALIELMADGMRGKALADTHIDYRDMWVVLGWTSHLFTGAIRVALPALVALMIVNVGFGAISRAAPSMNLFAVGFPITMSLGFIVIWMSLRMLPGAFQTLWEAAGPLMRHLAG